MSPGVFHDHLVNSKDNTRCKFSLETIGCMGGFIFFIVGSTHPNKTIIKKNNDNNKYGNVARFSGRFSNDSFLHTYTYSVYEFSVLDVKGYKL